MPPTPTPTAPKVTKSSTCLCGAISLTATGTDKGTVLCHCSNCQKGSGSAFAHNYRFTNASLAFQRGEDLVKQYADSNTKSGATLLRHWCGVCVSPSLHSVFVNCVSNATWES